MFKSNSERSQKTRAHTRIKKAAEALAVEALKYRHAEEYGRLYAAAYQEEMLEASEDGRWPYYQLNSNPEPSST